MIKVGVCGAGGRMGQTVVEAVRREPDMQVAVVVDIQEAALVSRDFSEAVKAYDLEPVIALADVIVDFTNPDGVMRHALLAAKHKKPMITGVTGLSAKQLERLQELAVEIPLVYAPNMSIGVNLLYKLIEQAARVLGDYDFEIVEMHHRHKKDAPSGTAGKMAEILSAFKEGAEIIYGRSGFCGERMKNIIAVHSLRGGEVVGEHRVIFAGPGERLELVHKAETRMTFAAGVIRAIRFIVAKEPGFYGMNQVLGI